MVRAFIASKEEYPKTYTCDFNWHSPSSFKERTFGNLNYRLLLNVDDVIAVVVVVVPRAGCVVKHLHPELVVAFPLEVYQAGDLLVVGTGKLLPASVEEHAAFTVEQHLDRPAAKAAVGFP
jgi:hypothetical protein